MGELWSYQKERSQASLNQKVAENERRVILDDSELMLDRDQKLVPEND